MKKVIKYMRANGTEWFNTHPDLVDCSNFDITGYSAAELLAEVLRDCHNIEATAEGDVMTATGFHNEGETVQYIVQYFESTEKHITPQKRYDTKHRVRYTLDFVDKTESDILEHLKKQPVVARYIKNLIRADIKKGQEV